MADEYEYTTMTLTVDESFQQQINKLIDEGWVPQPNTKPVAVYHLVRAKPSGALGGVGTMGFDESKIMIIRNGQVVEG